MTRKQLKEHIDELLEYEEEHDILWLTTREERREFQQGVQALFDAEHELIDKVLEIVDEKNDTKALVAKTPLGNFLHDTLANEIKAAVEELKGGEPE